MSLDQIRRITQSIYNDCPERLEVIYRDVKDLYDGKWPEYEACEVGYHTFHHVQEVAIATAYMIAGWNKAENKPIPLELYLCGIAASLFHDAGYIKDKGDKEGRGGKFSFTHEGRSANMAREYLKRHNWPERSIEIVPEMIMLTDFKVYPAPSEIFTELERAVAQIVASADLLAQMADPNYIEHLNDLFEEMQEAYEFTGEEELKRRGIKRFSSVEDMKEKTLDFFEYTVVPRFKALGSMYHYINYLFPIPRNPYVESIIANLMLHDTEEQYKWKKIGELLEEMGLVSSDDIIKALRYQNSANGDSKSQKVDIDAPKYSLGLKNVTEIIDWMETHSGSACLGDILVRMGAMSPDQLREAIKEQLLPKNLIRFLTTEDFHNLLITSMMLGYVRNLPHLFSQVLTIVNQSLNCEASSILLADAPTETLVFVVSTGPKQDDLKGLSIPWDKGVAGWVFSNKKATVVNDVCYDKRFCDMVDKTTNFRSQSILGVPLYHNGNVIGVLEAVNKRNAVGVFNQRDIAFLSIIANQLSGCIDSISWLQEYNRFLEFQQIIEAD